MKLDPKSLAITCSLVWGGSLLAISVANVFVPDYGRAFLDVIASVYPGYHPGGFAGAALGTIYALIDGAVAGWVVAWLYNRMNVK